MTLDGHQDAVTCLNLTHDGMKIITGSLDYSLKFWDLSTGKVSKYCMYRLTSRTNVASVGSIELKIDNAASSKTRCQYISTGRSFL